MQFANSKVGGIHFDAPRLLAQGLLAKPAAPATRSSTRAQSIAMTATSLLSGQEEALNLMEEMLIASQVSAKTNEVIHRELSGAIDDPNVTQLNQPQNLATNPAQSDPAQTLDTMTALILGSPEFQMH
jgi:hypothetical protein